MEYSKYLYFLVLAVIGLFIYFKHKKEQGGGGKTTLNSNSPTPFLDMYTVDFNEYVVKGRVDPVIGRTDEVQQLSRVLSRRRKNNAVLVGDPGVGKTAVVEGLAQRIINKDVPNNLAEKRVLALEVANLMAGTKYRGEFEERARKIVKEIAESGRGIILFIDEVHAVVQSHGAEGAINFADILKPALARGELQMIGATTHEEYEKYIRADLSLERRFQPILIDEPSLKETLEILQGVKEKYSQYHKVEFTDASLETAAKMSKQLIKDRRLPDKAIDALDEAGAMVNVSHVHESIPVVLYKTAVAKNPKVADIWKQIQEVDKKIVSSNKKETTKLNKRREELEKELENQGVMTIDSDDIEKVIKDWIS